MFCWHRWKKVYDKYYINFSGLKNLDDRCYIIKSNKHYIIKCPYCKSIKVDTFTREDKGGN